MKQVATEVLAGLPVLLAAAEEGSATRAAGRLQTTPATVLRRLEAVESALGVRLFERLPTGLSPTPALEVVLPWAERGTSTVDGMLRDLAGLESAPSGVVRLALPPVLATHLLIPGLDALRARCPGLTLELASATSVVDLSHREADLALRAVRPTQPDLVLRKLLEYPYVVACSRGLRERTRSATLAEMPWLSWDRTLAHIPEARWLTTALPDARVVLLASDLHTLMGAARAGLGALVLPEPMVALEPDLVRLPATGDLPSGALWLVAHRALRHVPRVAAVWAWIEDHLDTLTSDVGSVRGAGGSVGSQAEGPA